MCHVLLILPLLALPVFWVLPLEAAVPAYGAVLALSIGFYAYAMRAMRLPRQNGPEGMMGETGHIVVNDLGEQHVQVRNELWAVTAAEPLREGDSVEVMGAEGTILRVQKLRRDTRLVPVRFRERSA